MTDKTSTPLTRVTAPSAPGSSWEESVKARRHLSYEHTESVHSCKDTEAAERESILYAPRKRNLDGGTDFEAPIDCHKENGLLQDGLCENEDTDKENGTQVKGDEPSSEIPPKKGLYESENQILLHNEAMDAALDNIDEVKFVSNSHDRTFYGL